MPYVNERYQRRLVIVAQLQNPFSTLYVTEKPAGATEVALEGAVSAPLLYQVEELGAKDGSKLFNFPFLFYSDGSPWLEANSYLWSFVKNRALSGRATDNIRRRASKLIDYLMHCEDEEVSWLDFSGRRPSLRPTYKYFEHLKRSGKRSAAVINQYTGVIYDFYKFVASNWHNIDMERVDTVKQVKFLVETSFGHKLVSAEKRSQTKQSPPPNPVPIGFVRDDGEDLRPLANSELGEMLKIVRADDWSTQERLIIMTALMTGARKQSVLTLRLKHLKQFTEDKLRKGTYLLHAGPGTGIDTKNQVSQRLYIPEQLAEDLKVWAYSPMAVRRRNKFQESYKNNYADLPPMHEDDVYVFLSDQGGCYYMAADDPRYDSVKSPPIGQVTGTLKKKIFAKTSNTFPRDFSFHWLRATYAFQLYQLLVPQITSGKIKPGEEISFIQNRMHHKNRETTENYLKLFKMHSDKLAAQELYEKRLLGFSSYDDLKIEEE